MLAAFVVAAFAIAHYATASEADKTASATLAPCPPMGWNSWDSYGLTITESQFRENVGVLATQLKPYGWNYAVIDEGWFLKNPLDRETPGKLQFEIDKHGRYIPVAARFPSAVKQGENTGFTELGSYVHSLGLRFGIHIVRGVPRQSVTSNLPIAGSSFRTQDAADTTDPCPWDPTNWGVRDTPAGQAWYDSLLNQYATWGVDYLKVDCVSDHPYKQAEIHMLHQAIRKTGRPMLLSLSPGPTSAGHAQELMRYAQMWRVSDDLWDYWDAPKGAIRDQFPLAAGWVPFANPGHWPDLDMLPLGYLGPLPGEGEARMTRLTHDEQRTLMTLWSMARSPLVLGANLTRLDPWTASLVTNREVLAVDQFSHDQMQQSREHDLISWTSKGLGDRAYLALFNAGDTPRSLHHGLDFYGFAGSSYVLRDLWAQQTLGAMTSVDVEVPPHGCVLYQLTPVTVALRKDKARPPQ